jgi:hypothetical protein
VDWFADTDGDGFGDPNASENDCVQPSGYLLDSSDCDDGDATISPDALESCDTDVDDDCDGTPADCVWSVDAADALVWSENYGGGTISGFANSLAFGDFDADGMADVVIDAVHIVLGPVSGESNVDDASIQLTSSVGVLGTSGDGGEANGDDNDDLLVGSTSESTAYLFLGPITVARDVTDADADFGTAKSLEIGWQVDLGPDFDGDGIDDVFLGAPYDTPGDKGRVYVASGAVSGSIDVSSGAAYVYNGVLNEPIGYTDTSVGDVDGDGFGDLAILDSAVYPSHLYLVTGGAPAGTYDVAAAATATVTGAVNNWSVGQAGADTDGDGYSDLLVSGPDCVWGFLGPLSATLDETDASVTWQAEETGFWSFGTEGLATGDVDGDKEPDVVIGDFGANRYAGATYVQLGPATGVIDAGTLPSIVGDPNDYLGWRVGTVADWTGDGTDEILIGVTSKKDDVTGAYGAVAVFLSDGLY